MGCGGGQKMVLDFMKEDTLMIDGSGVKVLTGGPGGPIEPVSPFAPAGPWVMHEYKRVIQSGFKLQSHL